MAFEFNYVDVEIAKRICICDCVSIIPHAGGRGGRFKQDFHINNKIISIRPRIHDHVEMENKFDGVGFKAGLDAVWDVGCGLSIVSNASGSILFGHKKNNFEEKILQRTVPADHERFKDHACTCRYIADIGLAVRWEATCGCGTFGLIAGYEGHFFFNMNDFANEKDIFTTASTSQGARADVCVQGANFGAYFKF